MTRRDIIVDKIQLCYVTASCRVGRIVALCKTHDGHDIALVMTSLTFAIGSWHERCVWVPEQCYHRRESYRRSSYRNCGVSFRFATSE